MSLFLIWQWHLWSNHKERQACWLYKCFASIVNKSVFHLDHFLQEVSLPPGPWVAGLHVSPLDDLRHGLHDNPGPQVFLREVFPIRLHVEIILRGVVQVGNVQVDLRKSDSVICQDSIYLSPPPDHLACPLCLWRWPWCFSGDRAISRRLSWWDSQHSL